MAPRAIATLTVALPAILLAGCAGTGCEEWDTRVESVKVCNSKGLNCSMQEQPVQYCARKTGERAAPAAARGKAPAAPAQPKEARAPEKTARAAPAPIRPEAEREAPAAKQPKEDRRAQARDKNGMPNLNPFWQSLFAASRYPGLRYGKLRRVAMSAATAPASSPQVEAALKSNVRSVVSMQVASDSKSTPMDHRLEVVVYRAHDREAAAALYAAMMREEWRDKRPQTQPGVTLAVVKTGDKKTPDASGQRIYLQRGPYVVEVDEWKSIYRNAAGKPVPGKQFPHTGPISPGVVAKAVTQTFPAE
ncbi:MAG TPA: hypothetical protein VLV56_17050 [Burkholderiales bacterium]|nr:hypothetical protein [Burkholderiales bacterium]